jgi:phosphatidylinositol-3-phosphatase
VAMLSARTAVLAVIALVASLGAAAAPPARAAAPNPCSLGVARPATYAHVVVIFEENDTYAKVIGNANAPYVNQLAADCALATNYHDDATVSQPNYMAVTGGQATGVGVKVNAPSIFSQAPSWIELEEGMASSCGGTATFYKRGHDPAYWYTPLASACKLFDVPIANSDSGAATIPDPLPAYTFITPNLCHNHHWASGCAQADTDAANLRVMDTWLSGTVQKIAATADYQAGRTLILIAFDESGSSSTSQVAMVAVSGSVVPTRDPTFYDHYALLRASEEALGITTFLGSAATAADMRPGMGF